MMKKWIQDNFISAIFGVAIIWFSWSNRQQLDNIALKQDNSILVVQSDAKDKFVSRNSYEADMNMLKVSDINNSTAIYRVAESVSKIETGIAVLNSKLESLK